MPYLNSINYNQDDIDYLDKNSFPRCHAKPFSGERNL